MVDVQRKEGRGPEGLRRPGNHIGHLGYGIDRRERRGADHDMFRRPRKTCPGRVDLHAQRVFDVARDHRAAEEMDVRQLIHKTRRAMNVGKRRRPVGTGLVIEIFRRRTAGADMYPVATKTEVMP